MMRNFETASGGAARRRAWRRAWFLVGSITAALTANPSGVRAGRLPEVVPNEPADGLPENLRPSGPNAVGFRVETLVDRSSPFRLDLDSSNEARYRTIRAFLWYPAQAGSEGTPSARRSVRSYVTAEQPEQEDLVASPSPELLERLRALGAPGALGSQGVDAAVAAQRLLSVSTAARPGATPAEGRFPLIVIAPGGATPAGLHLLLAEELASQGFVVVAIPSVPLRSGQRWPFDGVGVSLHQRDMDRALDRALEIDFVDRDRIGLVSWSVGGVAQALMQMTNPDIGAVVSLDGATGYVYGLNLLRASVFFDPNGLSVPYLHAHGLAPAEFEVRKDFTVYESLSSGPSYLLTFPDLAHADFMSRAVLEKWAAGAESSPRVIESYALLLRITARFLKDHLRADPAAASDFHRWLIELEKSAGIGVESRQTGGRSIDQTGR